MELTVRAFLKSVFRKNSDIDPRIDEVLEAVNLKGHENAPANRKTSGGQQARLLLHQRSSKTQTCFLMSRPISTRLV